MCDVKLVTMDNINYICDCSASFCWSSGEFPV